MRRSCRFAVGTLTIAAALVPATAQAAVTTSLPSRAELSAKILVTVPVTVACGPYDQSVSSTSVSVTVEQAVSKGIARGSAFKGGFMDPTFALTCDGAAHVYPIPVVADASGLPFKNGNAIVSASASAVFGCCTSETGAAGPQVIKLN